MDKQILIQFGKQVQEGRERKGYSQYIFENPFSILANTPKNSDLPRPLRDLGCLPRKFQFRQIKIFWPDFINFNFFSLRQPFISDSRLRASISVSNFSEYIKRTGLLIFV